MYKVLIIGAGQLGSRHLQGILKIKIPTHIEVFDINQESLTLAEKRANEIEKNENILSIKYLNNLNQLSSKIDLAIIATTSGSRYKLFIDIINNYNIKNIVLEKIVFQNENEYEKAKEILIKNQINCWINCPRRMHLIYQEIKSKIKYNERVNISINGYDWGLACNSIHFIDLMNYFTNDDKYYFDTTNISEIIDSKRENYFEFLGQLIVTSISGNKIILNSEKDPNSMIKIKIETNEFLWEIDELNNSYNLHNKLSHSLEENILFNVPYQSQLTDIFAENILKNNNTMLPHYLKTYNYHKQMIVSFTELFVKIQKIKHCKIT
jgi:hypothetical protein